MFLRSRGRAEIRRRRQPNFGRRASRIWFAPAGKVAAARPRGLIIFPEAGFFNFAAGLAKNSAQMRLTEHFSAS